MPRYRTFSSGSPARTPVAIVLALTLAVAACQSTAPSASPVPTPPLTPAPATPMSREAQTALYAAIERQVEAIRELVPKRPVNPVLLDEAGLRQELECHADEDNPPAKVGREERLLKAMGVVARDADLRAIVNAFLTGQIAGFYRPTDGHLYVVSRSGALGAVERTTFAHEYTHALQDQNFPLLQELDDAARGPLNSDRDLARLAVIEGDATLVMSLWAQDHLSPLDLLQLLASSFEPSQQAALDAMPPFLRQQALFPYEAGLQFAMGRQLESGWPGLNAAFAAPPASTEQVLHPDKYASHEAPVEVILPKDLPSKVGPGWLLDSADILGEFQARTWLEALGVPAAQAATATAGWGGDRMALLHGPESQWVLVLATKWDSRRDATEFGAAAGMAVSHLSPPGATRTQDGATLVFIASDPSTLDNAITTLMASGPLT